MSWTLYKQLIVPGITNSSFNKIKATTQTDTYNVAATDELVVCNKATALTVNLPAATGSGRYLEIKNINTGVVTLDGASSDTIDGEDTQYLYDWEGVQIVDYATNKWVVV